MLRLNCFFQAKEGRLDDALAAAKELTAASLDLARRGCARGPLRFRAVRQERHNHQRLRRNEDREV